MLSLCCKYPPKQVAGANNADDVQCSFRSNSELKLQIEHISVLGLQASKLNRFLSFYKNFSKYYDK